MFPKRAFITFSNEKYLPLISKLVESVLEFSAYPIIVYTYNFSHNFNSKRVYCKRIDDSLLDVPEYINNTNSDNIGIVTRDNFNSYYTLSRKPTIITDAIENGLEEGIFLDGDGIVSETIDEAFRYISECDSYPLVGKGLFDYMILNSKGGIEEPLELPLMKYLSVDKRSMHYVQTNFIVFNKNCKLFFEECASISNQQEVLNNFYTYAPWQDETIINVLLWKYNANKHLPISHFNLSDYEELLNFFENDRSNYHVKDCPWHYIPQNKNDIKIFHGCKSPMELEKCISYLKKRKHTVKTLTKSKTNSYRIAIVTLFDKNYEELAKYSLPNKLAYANKHGYDFYYYDKTLDCNRPPQWSKILAIQNVLNLNKYDWVWWIDIDSLVMNFNVRLESILDDSYDIILTHNKHSYISNGSSFFKNSDTCKQFLNDSYVLEKDYLKNIDINVFDHEQQSMRLLVLNDSVYKEKTKLIDERVCNSYCVTHNQSVLSSYPNWNVEPNIYKDGDFVIQFCGRTFQERILDYLNYILPKKVALVLLSDDQSILQKQIESAKKSRFELELYFPNIDNPNGFSSYSQVINESVCNTESEYMIFVNPKTILNEFDIESMIKDLMTGKCFVSVIGFGLFATTKSLFKQTGLMDERFLGGEYEDNDFAIRLRMLNKAVKAHIDFSKYSFQSTPSKYNPIRGCALSLFLDKWNPNNDFSKYVITEKNLRNKNLPATIKVEENIKYSWLDFDKSDIGPNYYIFNHLKSVNITTAHTEKSKVESEIKLICKYDADKNLFVEFLSVTDQVITVHINDVSNPSIHAPIYNNIIKSNTWWGTKLENKLYEFRVFHQGILLYKTILHNQIENVITFRVYSHIFA